MRKHSVFPLEEALSGRGPSRRLLGAALLPSGSGDRVGVKSETAQTRMNTGLLTCQSAS